MCVCAMWLLWQDLCMCKGDTKSSAALISEVVVLLHIFGNCHFFPLCVSIFY